MLAEKHLSKFIVPVFMDGLDMKTRISTGETLTLATMTEAEINQALKGVREALDRALNKNPGVVRLEVTFKSKPTEKGLPRFELTERSKPGNAEGSR